MYEAKGRSGLIISVVDDDDSFRCSLARLIGSLGFKVREYESARAFLASDTAFSSDCLIIDLRMPEMSGFRLADRLQELDTRVPTIFVSGDVQAGDRERARELGGSFLEKPFDAESLHQGHWCIRLLLVWFNSLAARLFPTNTDKESRSRL
jgi:FixJ family two-component response regulator